MTFDEFLEKCREVDGWRLVGGGALPALLRNKRNDCPLQAVSGEYSEYRAWGRGQGLAVRSIISAADGFTDGPYRKALLTLVKEKAQ